MTPNYTSLCSTALLTQMQKDSGAERYADMTPSWRWLGLSWVNDQIPLLPSLRSCWRRSHTCPCDRRQGALYLGWLADKRAPICKHRRPPENSWVPSTLDLSVITNANRRTDRSPACHSSRLQSCRKTPLSSPWSSKGQEDSLILCTREPFPPPVPGSNHLCKKFHPPLTPPLSQTHCLQVFPKNAVESIQYSCF